MSVRLLARGAVLAVVAVSLSSISAGAQGTTTATPVTNPTVRLAKVAVGGSALKSFDIGWVDPSNARYYLADRSNASVDILDTNTSEMVGKIGGFKGFTGNNDTSGPNGVVVTINGTEAWVGDGDSLVRVVDLRSRSITATVNTGGKNRADELAFDPMHGLIVIANDADDPPFLSFISTGSRTVMGKLEFPNADDGLEQPVFDPASGMIFQAVPSQTDQIGEGGEIDSIDPVKMTVVSRFPLSDCHPHGLALGPGHQLLAGCSTNTHSLIIDDTNGKVMGDFPQTAASDEVWFNPGDNRYYLAERGPETLGVIDAGSLSFVQNVEAGLGDHSVAADMVNNHIFVPITAPDPACPNGCVLVFAGAMTDKGNVPR